jgi:secretion/DNA translocation related TadE-like protein
MKRSSKVALHRDHEKGSGTVLGIALIGVISMLGFLAVAQAQATLLSHSVQGAADLSAIAGAQSFTDPCARAESIASSNRVRLTRCFVDGADVSVEVEAATPSLVAKLLNRFGLTVNNVRAVATAGPPDFASVL